MAKEADSTRLKELGQAALHIVHDLKNQLNGLKLYATFLRKRMERDDRPQDECETVAKLIAGLDRAAQDLTALVRYAQPTELRCQPQIDLSKIISKAIDESHAAVPPGQAEQLTIDGMKVDAFRGNFDEVALTGAFKTLVEHASPITHSRPNNPTSISIRRDEAQASPEALIEWTNINPARKEDPFHALDSIASVRMALAAKIIEAHGGRVEHNGSSVRVWLPLTA